MRRTLCSKVVCKLTCKRFNSLITSKRRTGDFVTRLCCEDDNYDFFLEWKTPLYRNLYKYAAKGNSIRIINYLLPRIGLPKQAFVKCLKYDRKELFEYLYRFGKIKRDSLECLYPVSCNRCYFSYAGTVFNAITYRNMPALKRSI